MRKAGQSLLEQYRALEAEQGYYVGLGAVLLYSGFLIFLPPPENGWLALLGLSVLLSGFYCLFLAMASWRKKRALVRSISTPRVADATSTSAVPGVIIEEKGNIWKWLLIATIVAALVVGVSLS